jgi:hypothetical protein
MFLQSKAFNQNISKWNVDKVRDNQNYKSFGKGSLLCLKGNMCSIPPGLSNSIACKGIPSKEFDNTKAFKKAIKAYNKNPCAYSEYGNI